MDAQGEQTAGSVVKGVSPMLGMIPMVGPILSMAGTMVGGYLEQDAGKKQQEQAANLQKQATAMLPNKIQSEYGAKYRGDMSAALAGLPGIDMYKQFLADNMATHMRAIKENSPNGGAAVNAMSLALGQENAAVNKLGLNSAEYSANKMDEALKDLWGVGEKKDAQQAILDEKKKAIFSQANNLSAAGTANKMGGINKMIGGVTSTISELSKYGATDNNDMFNQWLAKQNNNTALPESTPGYDANGMAVSANPTMVNTDMWSGQNNGFNPNDYSIPDMSMGSVGIQSAASSPLATWQ
jgi:hypothetical protein